MATVYNVYHKVKSVSRKDFFTGQYDFIEMTKGELVGTTTDEDRAIEIFAEFNVPDIFDQGSVLCLSGYWMERVEDGSESFVVETDFEEVAEDLELEYQD